MSQDDASQQSTPPIGTLALMRLLTVSRIAPIVTGLIGHQFFGHGYLGVVAGFAITVTVAAYVGLRAGLNHRWQLLVWLPVALWGIGILWWGLTRY